MQVKINEFRKQFFIQNNLTNICLNCMLAMNKMNIKIEQRIKKVIQSQHKLKWLTIII